MAARHHLPYIASAALTVALAVPCAFSAPAYASTLDDLQANYQAAVGDYRSSVVDQVKNSSKMIALQNELSAESYRKDIGKTFEVLVEGVSKRSRSQLFGRTSQNKVVVFDRGEHHVGDFVNVKVTEASSATLKGVEVM